MKKIILTALAVLMMLCFVGCGEHLVSTTTITFLDGSVLHLVGVGSVGMKINGSPFGWNGGAEATVDGSGYVYTVTANADNFGNGDWVSSQSPFKDNYPEGFDASAKLEINGAQGFVPFKKGGTVSYLWSSRK